MFRSWGRIGTTIGGNKLEEIVDKHGAMEQFRTLFLEKTGNNFLSASYAKLPGKWTVLDIDYSEVSFAFFGTIVAYLCMLY